MEELDHEQRRHYRGEREEDEDAGKQGSREKEEVINVPSLETTAK